MDNNIVEVLVHSTYDANRLISSQIQVEVKQSILNLKTINKATPTRDIILFNLRNNYGWSDEVTLSAEARISITSKKEDIGLCLQTGNMSRFYADLLKLEYLFKKGFIHSAIYIIPERKLALSWGDNIANYERFIKELKIFSSIIRVPVLVYGIKKNKVL